MQGSCVSSEAGAQDGLDQDHLRTSRDQEHSQDPENPHLVHSALVHSWERHGEREMAIDTQTQRERDRDRDRDREINKYSDTQREREIHRYSERERDPKALRQSVTCTLNTWLNMILCIHEAP